MRTSRTGLLYVAALVCGSVVPAGSTFHSIPQIHVYRGGLYDRDAPRGCEEPVAHGNQHANLICTIRLPS